MPENERKREVAHDETPAIIADHAYVPRAEWWSLCRICGLAEAAHAETTHPNPHPMFNYYSDDVPDED